MIFSTAKSIGKNVVSNINGCCKGIVLVGHLKDIKKCFVSLEHQN